MHTILEVSYFPGCSLATTARESNQSLVAACALMGLRLTELEDWNCCGSSSAHSVDPELALGLAARSLSLAPSGRALLTMCPSCFRNLLSAHEKMKKDPELRQAQERKWGRLIDPDLRIINFLEILHFLDRLRGMGAAPDRELPRSLAGIKIAPYYGCMAMFPPNLSRAHPNFNLMEKQLKAVGAEVLMWSHQHRCCGTFLTVARPDVATPLVREIMTAAVKAGADCLVTACAMCQLNLEIRAGDAARIPTLHFSEVLALALGADDYEPWFSRHLIDPRPLLRSRELIT